MLTRKQLELLLFINERLKEEGVPPSFEEMKEALNLQSKSGVHRLIDTGGVDEVEGGPFGSKIAEQARAAIEEADLVLFVVDARVGITPGDEELAEILRVSRRPVLVVANKLDDARREFPGTPEEAFPSEEHPYGVQNVYIQTLADLTRAVEFDQSQLFKKIYEEEYGVDVTALTGAGAAGGLVVVLELLEPADVVVARVVEVGAAVAGFPGLGAQAQHGLPVGQGQAGHRRPGRRPHTPGCPPSG